MILWTSMNSFGLDWQSSIHTSTLVQVGLVPIFVSTFVNDISFIGRSTSQAAQEQGAPLLVF